MPMYVGTIESYTPVEYIESSGTQSIDTGVKPSSSIRTIVDFQLTSLPSATSQGIVGAWDANKGMIFGVQNNSGNLVFRFAFGTSAWAGSSIAADTNRHTVYMNDENGNGRLDNTTLANGSSATSLSYTYGMTLFSFMGSVTYKAHCKIYSCKMYENDTLIRDFIPVLDQNNVACMYEQVEEKFYYNRGTGVFTAGNATGQPVIGESVAKNIPQAFVGINGVARKIKKGYVGTTITYTPVEYIESSGTQYIDTNIQTTDVFKIDLEFARTNLTANDGVCGSYTGSQWGLYFYPSSNGKYGCAYGTQNVYVVDNTNYNDTSKHHVVIDLSSAGLKTTVDNTLISTNNFSSIDNGLNFWLFKCNDGGGSRYSKIKLYSFKIYKNDVLVRDYIPVLSDRNIALLYDLVENKPYYNKGTGDFLAGNTTGQPIIASGVARRFYWHFPYAYMPEADSGIVKTYVGNEYGIAKTADYIITVGGRKIANTNMNTTASEALNANGVLTTITNHAMRMPGGMEVNGNAVFCCGNSSTSANSGSYSVVSYSNELVKTTLSNFGTSAYGVFPAANSVHGIRMGGNGYSTARNTVDILNNELVRTAGTSLSTSRKANGTAAVGNYILTAAGSSSGSSSGGALKTVEAYDNNNVKTSATSLAEAAWYKTGISTKKYAIFYGGRLSNENGKSTNNFSYFNDNLVLTTIEFPYSCYNGVGLQIDDFILIGSGDVMETAGGSATYPAITYLFTEDLVRIKEISGPPSDASWTQRRYQLLGNRLYYEGYKTGFGYYKY